MRRLLKKIYSFFYKNSNSNVKSHNNKNSYGQDVNIEFIGSAKPKFSIGVGSYSNGMKIYCWDENVNVRIGNYCSIADNVIITAGGEHEKEWVSSYPFIKKYHRKDLFTKQKKRYKGDVIIGNDVWIANNVSILSGVTIGDGAVVGAGSNVVKNIEPYGIATGNPAKVIKKRFDSEDIEALLKIEWWNWPINKIMENLELFDNVKLFIKHNRNL